MTTGEIFNNFNCHTMKKYSTFFARLIILLALAFLNYNYCKAQTNTKISANQINVSITGIEYDDPGFALLKESLQKTKNVSSFKQSYDQGTAKIALTYKGNAQTLWDELPKTTKQFFKLTGINDNSIELQSKNALNENTVSAINTTSAPNSNKNDDCKNCYINLCKYDDIKTFQGVAYKQMNKDDGTYYYNCDNGVLVVKQVIKNGYGVTTNITNDTILVSSGPIGTKWGLRSNASSFLGLNSQYFTVNTLIAKGITTKVNGITYTDVIVVNSITKSSDNFLGGSSNTSVNNYYAKGVGLIKSENTDPDKDPLEGTKKSKAFENLPGIIDNSIVGSWKYHDASGMEMTYKFNSDGTYEYYVGSDKWFKDLTCNWKLNGNKIEMLRSDIKDPYSFFFQKKNDPVTGKPELTIQFRGDEYRDYISLDGKAPWK